MAFKNDNFFNRQSSSHNSKVENTTNDVSKSEKKHKRFWTYVKNISVVVGILASIVTVLSFLSPKDKDENKPPLDTPTYTPIWQTSSPKTTPDNGKDIWNPEGWEISPRPTSNVYSKFIYYLNQDDDYIHKLSLDGNIDEVVVDKTCIEILYCDENIIVYKTGHTYFEDDSKVSSYSGKSYKYDINADTNIEIPYFEDYFFEYYFDNYSIYVNNNEKKFAIVNNAIVTDIIYYDAVPGWCVIMDHYLYFLDVSNNYYLTRVNLNNYQINVIAESSYAPSAVINNRLYLYEIIWIDNEIGKSWNYGGLLEYDSDTEIYKTLTGIRINVNSFLFYENGFAFFSTNDGIEKLNTHDYTSKLLYPGGIEYIQEMDDYIYFYTKPKSGPQHDIGVGRINKDGTEYRQLVDFAIFN
ncbi:hypothetical protein LJC42_05590 [Eubacteriales bacterium OttesenSCG-928-K08]|nr:hypothetical protein [Eubacteriales bacterium OttesenSCG-928-K08]